MSQGIGRRNNGETSGFFFSYLVASFVLSDSLYLVTSLEQYSERIFCSLPHNGTCLIRAAGEFM